MFKVAIIMSVYKNDKQSEVKEALESLYHQTRKADIFIQQDGGLPYELSTYLENEFNKNRINYLGKRKENRGLAYSLNELLKIVIPRYKYIVRMDADDISSKNRIAIQVDFLEKNKDIDAVGGWIKEFNITTKKTKVVFYYEKSEDIKLDLMKHNPIAHVTICFRNTFFDIIPQYDIRKSNEDLDLWIRALKKNMKLYNLQEVLVEVRTSIDFFKRRRNLKRALELMYLKFDATKHFKFGFKGYLYGIAHCLLFLAPVWIQVYVYRELRGKNESSKK